MQTEEDINTSINKLATTMDVDFPELLKYVDEMPITNPDTSNPIIDTASLHDYYDSLDNLMKKYQQNKGGVAK
jgi:hypothetical protein